LLARREDAPADIGKWCSAASCSQPGAAKRGHDPDTPDPDVRALLSCGNRPAASLVASAKTEAVAHESDVLKPTLPADAQARIGIVTVRVEQRSGFGEGSA